LDVDILIAILPNHQSLLAFGTTFEVNNIPSSTIPSSLRQGWGAGEEENIGASNPPSPNRTAGQIIVIRMEQELFLPTFALLCTSGKEKTRVLLSDLLSTYMITSFLFCTSIVDFDPIYVSIGDTTYYSSLLTGSIPSSSLFICPNPLKNWGNVYHIIALYSAFYLWNKQVGLSSWDSPAYRTWQR
jgi:hypothetical protein